MIFSKQIENAFLNRNKISKMEDLQAYFGSDIHKSMYSPVFRMIESYKSRNINDFLANLRQCIMYSNTRIHMPSEVLKTCKKYENEYGFRVDSNLEWVEVKPYAMEEYDDLKYTYVMKKRRKMKSTISDSALINHFGYEKYVSLQQKCMIYTSKQLKKGECYLACLPTGSGKSLLWQSAVARGQFKGVTLVVVPTVALALDHKRSDERVMERLPWIESIAYTSKEYAGVPEKMEQLKEKIVKGKQKIIYISPEGLTNPEIKRALEEAAKLKNISAVVIDETHLVIDWGMNFRPEFQFLPALIDNLKLYSDNEIVTLLLSATVTENDKEVLHNLFGAESMIEFRGDELRVETEYYIQYCRTEEERQKYIKELLRTVPRPAIVYVGTIEQSETIYEEIKLAGFGRVGLFNSEVNDKEKDQLLDDWNGNHVDIMVATSAFGMGVDKSDVRTVITAYTPENISRFYQEVGRSGRDGYASISFSLYCPTQDSGVVSSYTDSKVISADNLVKRWRAMLSNTSQINEFNGANVVWLDTNTAPEHLEFKKTGGKNSKWNEDTISMLARAGMIKVLDVHRNYTSNHKSFFIKVEINDDYISILESNEKLEKCISSFRDEERKNIRTGIEIVRNMYKGQKEKCISDYLREEFIYANCVCSGCSYCRMWDMDEYIETGEITIYSERKFQHNEKMTFQNGISKCIEKKCFGTLVYENKIEQELLNQIIASLIINQCNIIVIENHERIDMNLISLLPNDNYMILDIEEYLRIPNYLVFGTVAFFLEDDEEKNKKILSIAKKNRYNEELNQILIMPEKYYDDIEERYVSDYAEYGKKIKVLLQEETIC